MDEQNPKYMFQNTSTELLLKAAKGEINLTELAKAELANRGLGLRGQWVGFDAANRYWESHFAVRDTSGKMKMVSVPDAA